MESTTPPAAGPSTPPPPAPGAAGSGNDGFDSLRRLGLVRTRDRWAGGVCGGVARRFGIDPLVVRGILGVTVLLGGAGLVLYGLAWALLPEETDGRIHLQETIRGRFDAALLGALAAVIVGLNRGDGWFGWWDGDGRGWVNGLLWAAALAAVIALLVTAASQRSARRAPAGDPEQATWSAQAPPPPPRASRTVPHPGYGAVPLTSPSPSGPSPATAGWGSTPPPPPGSARPVGPGGPSGSTAFRPGQPPVPPPPQPRKPRVQGPGLGAVGAVVGLTLLALAGLLVAEREGRFDQPVALTALGIGIVLAGLGIIVSGLRGRSSGTLGFLAIVGLVAAVPAALLPVDDGRFGFVADESRFRVSSGEVWAPDTVAEAQRGISVGFGDMSIDLTGVPLDGDEPVEVPISMSAGDLQVAVPDGAAVTGEIALTAGQTSWEVDGTTRMAGFSGGPETFASEEAADGDVELAVRITAGAGDVRVVEEDR